MRARNRRRRDLRHTLQERSRMVEALLEAHRGDLHGEEPAVTAEPVAMPNPAKTSFTPVGT